MYWSGDRGYDSGNMSVGAEDRTVTITGRTTGLTYNITIVALSDHLPSPVVGAVMVTLGESHAGSVCYIKSLESLINTRTLKKHCTLAARTEVKQTQELYDRWANV